MRVKNKYFAVRNILKFAVNKRTNVYDGYEEYKNIKGEMKDAEIAEKGNILITPISGAMNHYVEGLFARKAILQGYHVSAFMCGGCLTKCESIQEKRSHKKIRCALCLARQEGFVKAYNVDSFTYVDMLTEDDMASINDYIESFCHTINDKHSYLGVDVGKVLYTALQRYYLLADPQVVDNSVTRGFLRTILMTLLCMDRAVKRIKPHVVFSSHGTYSTWGSVVEYCKAHDVYVVTFGQNYNHNGIEFTYNDSYLTGDLNDKSNIWLKHELTEDERKRVVRFFDERQGLAPDDDVAYDYNKGNKESFDRQYLCKLLDIDGSKTIVGMYPNIPWDGAVTGGSVVFPKFRDWLKFTIDFFSAHQEAILVIRSHPAEVLRGQNAGDETTITMLEEIYEKLPSNVIVLPPIHKVNSYTLARNAEFGITYSTTLTLEMTYMGKPVVLCGCPPFKDKNIGFDIASEDDYVKLLEQGLSGNLFVDEDRRERLYKYMHYFFFMRTMPQTLAEVHDTSLLKYKFSTEKELDADPCFDYMFHCIEDEKPMDFSRFYE